MTADQNSFDVVLSEKILQLKLVMINYLHIQLLKTLSNN